MNEPLCVATLTGPGVKPLVLQVNKSVVSTDYTFTINSFWEEGVDFGEALLRGYDHLSLAWHEVENGQSTGAVQEITYTAYGGFDITGTLTTEDHLSLSLAHIILQPRQAIYA